MANTISPQEQLEKTYNAAADHYDYPALSFWDRFGRRTVERLPLAPGMEVLDVCCGMGGSALPAAERVGPSGHVVAVDLAQNLLDKGARRAVERGLTNIEFRRGDLERLSFADQAFDAVICVFGIFFVPDLKGAVKGCGVLSARVASLRSRFGAPGCSSPRMKNSGKPFARQTLSCLGQSSPGIKSSSRTRFVRFSLNVA
jgi:ubiquinone/menaquinone biosynthesis C-methylase UbiE